MKSVLNKLHKLWLIFLLFFPAMGLAIEINQTVTPSSLSEKKQSESNKYLTAKQAYEAITANPDEVLFLDVRTRAEIEFVGWTPLANAVIPYMKNDFDEWDEKRSAM